MPIPLSLNENSQNSPSLRPRPMTRGGSFAAELQRIAEQVLEHGGEQGGLAQHHRQLAHLDRRVRAPHVGREVRPGLGEQHRAGHRLTALRGPPHPAEREQVVDQRLHPLGAVHRVLDVLVGLGVQLARVAALQQLAEAGHLAQRLLQVVRGHVGELLQFRVGPLQVLRPGLQGRVRGLQAGRRHADSSARMRSRIRFTSSPMVRISAGPPGSTWCLKSPSATVRASAASRRSGRIADRHRPNASTSTDGQQRDRDARGGRVAAPSRDPCSVPTACLRCAVEVGLQAGQCGARIRSNSALPWLVVGPGGGLPRRYHLADRGHGVACPPDGGPLQHPGEIGRAAGMPAEQVAAGLADLPALPGQPLVVRGQERGLRAERVAAHPGLLVEVATSSCEVRNAAGSIVFTTRSRAVVRSASAVPPTPIASSENSVTITTPTDDPAERPAPGEPGRHGAGPLAGGRGHLGASARPGPRHGAAPVPGLVSASPVPAPGPVAASSWPASCSMSASPVPGPGPIPASPVPGPGPIPASPAPGPGSDPGAARRRCPGARAASPAVSRAATARSRASPAPVPPRAAARRAAGIRFLAWAAAGAGAAYGLKIWCGPARNRSGRSVMLTGHGGKSERQHGQIVVQVPAVEFTHPVDQPVQAGARPAVCVPTAPRGARRAGTPR